MGRRMGRRIRVHGARALLPLLLILPTVVGGSRPAAAQADASVSLQLLSQTPWVAPTDERFSMRVLAHNGSGAAIGDLDVRLVVGPAFLSRSEFELSLPTGPTTVVHSVRIPVDGQIEPRGVRQVQIRVDPSTIAGLNPVDSGVYPLRVEVRSGGDTVGSLTSALVWIVRDPESPLSFSWWTELDAPLPLDVSGRLHDPGFEAAIDDGGTLDAQVDALAELAAREPDVGAEIDLVVRPALLEQLSRMADGYERTAYGPVPAGTGGAQNAAELLETLSRAAESGVVQVSAMPFAGPSIPALLAGGLQPDLEHQRDLGEQWTRDAIGVDPSVAVARPPGGLLSDEALAWLAAKGSRTVLADTDAVERPPQENEFAVPSTATVTTTRGDVTLVMPDPGAQALLERDDLLADPIRAAQLVFSELAVVWREAPVPPEPRGVALHLPTDLPAAMWQPLVARLAGAPFLSPTRAQEHVALVPPGPSAVLRDPSADVFSEGYADRLRTLRRDVLALASMYTEPSQQPARLRRNLLVAEALSFLTDELGGSAWIDSVAATTSQAFTRVTPQVQEFTLTSSQGTIPLLMGSPGPVPVEVSIQLLSNRLQFPGGNTQTVVLEPDRPQFVTFPVISTSAGRHQVEVTVHAPSGRPVSTQTVFVRSTALNQVALAVTGAAALVLVVLWLRRWVRRRAVT
jgi:hypothetical protein